MSALNDLKILDLSRILAGPFATQILADMGAEVWKIESAWGDDTRSWGPPFVGGESAYYLSANRGKKSIIINLRDKRGQNIIRDLAIKADILVENFKVGNLEKYGLDYHSLSKINPRLIYASVTGFGQTGPRAPEPGYDAALQGMTGIMSVTGNPDGGPTKVGTAWIDILTGLPGTIGILSALHERSISGKGQQVDVSLFDVGIACMANIAQSYLATGISPGRLGNAHPQVAPYQDFTASDGNFITAANNDAQFQRLCETIGIPEIAVDERFTTNSLRVENRSALADLLNKEIFKHPIEHWMTKLRSAGLTVTPINTMEDVFNDPQSKARNAIWKVDHPSLGKIDLLGSALQHLSRTPASPQGHPPMLGEHTFDIMEEVLNMTKSQIAELVSEGVIKGA